MNKSCLFTMVPCETVPQFSSALCIDNGRASYESTKFINEMLPERPEALVNLEKVYQRYVQ